MRVASGGGCGFGGSLREGCDAEGEQSDAASCYG